MIITATISNCLAAVIKRRADEETEERKSEERGEYTRYIS